MTQTRSNLKVLTSDIEALNQQTAVQSLIERIVQKSDTVELPGSEH